MSETIGLEPSNVVSQSESENEKKYIVLDVNPKNIVEIIKSTLINEEIKNKISIKLTPEIICVINKIISLTPDTLNDIEISALQIIKDGKIDSNDIPQFIVVVQRIYQVIYNFKDTKIDAKKRSELTATLLKFIIHLLVLERKIKIDQDKQEDLLKNCDILIYSCVGLLGFPKSLKTKGCIKKLFG